MTSPKLLIAGNWKMNGLRSDLSQINAIKLGVGSTPKVDVLLFPPATLISASVSICNDAAIGIGAQDCHHQRSGAFTGDLSAQMLKDAGARWVILGHSERRLTHGETSALVRKKVAAALEAGLKVIVCLGETRGERAAGLAESVCIRQLGDSLPEASASPNTVVAYEPVWSIGTGVSPSSAEISTMHEVLRASLLTRSNADDPPWGILYGGSVSPANAAEIFATEGVDGVLVGGASLNAASFLAIIAAAEAASEQPKS